MACSIPSYRLFLFCIADGKKHPKIHLIAGGFHLVVASDDAISKIVATLKDTFKVENIAPGHCTGEPTFAALKQAFGDHYIYAGVGTSLATGLSAGAGKGVAKHQHSMPMTSSAIVGWTLVKTRSGSLRGEGDLPIQKLTARRRGDRVDGGMSAIGPKQTWALALHMSACRGRADITLRLCIVGFLFRLRHSGRFAPTDCFGTILVSFPDAPNDNVGDHTHDRGNDQGHQELAHAAAFQLPNSVSLFCTFRHVGVGRMSALRLQMGVKRTCPLAAHMSAFDPKRTLYP